MKSLRTLIKSALLFTSFASAVFYTIWGINTYHSYSILQLHAPVIGQKYVLRQIGIIEYYQLLNKVKLVNQLSDYTLLIDKKYIKKLNSDLPYSITEYNKAFLVDNNKTKVYKGKARYRGDNAYHWLFDSKSWRFKASKKNLVEGKQKINFIIPKGHEVLNNHLSYKFSKAMGLLTPDSKLVTLSINSQYEGIKVLAEQIDEGFLRRNRRMPNDIYIGDNNRMSESSYLGLPKKLFFNPVVWGKSSYNNHYAKDNFTPLHFFFNKIENNQVDNISLEDFAKFSILLSLTGSFHVDNVHNWKISYDAYYEKFFPITWDIVGWYTFHHDYLDKSDTIISTSEVMLSLFKNYSFLYLRQREFIKVLKNKAVFLDILDKEVEKAKIKLEQQPFSLDLHHNLKTNKKIIERLFLLKEHVIKWLDDIEKNISTIGKYQWAFLNNKIALSINGRGIVDKLTIALYNPLQEKSKKEKSKIYLHYQNKEQSYRLDITNYTTQNDNHISIDIPLFANIFFKNHSNIENRHFLKFSEATYQLEIEAMQEKNIKDIKVTILNIKNSEVIVPKVANITEKIFNYDFSLLVDKEIKTTVWSQTKTFTGFNIITDNIIIEKGTRLIFNEGATVKVLGKVTALGSKEEPIVFQAKDKSKPWNAFVLKDEQANGSAFKYCTFQNGSGDKGELYEYTGMLSIHNVKDVLFEHCEFIDSHKTDDMVHIIYSDVTFKNTKFINSLSDALDVDISNVVVEQCEFIDSGNDAIDLMTSNAIVIDTKFINSADKGISIGEGSKLLAINNYIKNNNIGMQSKDTSQAYIYNTSFVQNKTAVDAYHKNWRYSEGGSIFLESSLFEKNKNNATVGKKSKVIINNSHIESEKQFDAKSLQKRKIIISHNDFIEATLDDDFFNNKSLQINKKMKGYYEKSVP